MLTNKTILLTGATGGIGSEISKLLVEEGATLILVGRSEARLQKLWHSLAGRHHLIQADISTSLGRKEILNYCQGLEQDIDIVINNAGIGQFSLFDELSEDELASIINVNLTSTMLFTQTLLPTLLSQSHAQVINIGSILGSIGLPGSTAYCASKFGLRGFTEALRRELLDSAVSVRYFAPRATKTEMNNEKVIAMNDELGTKMDSASYVAEQLVSFIKSNSASQYLGWPENLFVKINSMLPSIVERSIFKQLPIFKQYL